MSRLCGCHRKCRHLVPTGTDRLLPPAELTELAPFLGMLTDAADAFDADALTMVPECEVHGPKAVSNAECICRGTRYSAVEFVQALGLDVRASSAPLQHGPRYEAPSQDRRARWDRKQRQQRRAQLDVAV